MITRIELKNFESHKHTVIDNLSPSLNILSGDSNAGKTSIIRAIKLVAYNDFDPKSIRVGCKTCEVTVDTDKGRVKVTRGGKINSWEITPKGEKMIPLDSVGKAVVPRAAEIMGLNIVKLGDIDVPVNIMDQLESHFMLSGIGDKKASGSVRAQIIDEISGLSGIEGVINEVSLDRTRKNREVKDSEKKMEGFRVQLHPQEELEEEEEILKKATKRMETYEQLRLVIEHGEKELQSHKEIVESIRAKKERLDKIPDLSFVNERIKKAESLISKSERASAVSSEAREVTERIESNTKILNDMPDLPKAKEKISNAEFGFSCLQDALEIQGSWERITREREELSKRMEIAEKSITACPVINEVSDKMTKAEEARKTYSEWVAVVDTIKKNSEKLELAKGLDKANEHLQTMDFAVKVFGEIDALQISMGEILEKKEQLIGKRERADIRQKEALDEIAEIIKTVDICPLTELPLSQECKDAMENVRGTG